MANRFTNINADNAGKNDLLRFHGFYDNVYRDPFIGGNAFIFVTRPLLFIDYKKPPVTDKIKTTAYYNMTRDPFFAQYLAGQTCNPMDETLVRLLSYNTEYHSSLFLPMFTNQCKSIDLQDVTMEQMDAFDTKQGFRESLPTHKTQSEATNTISISVTEDSNLNFTKLISLWINYISNITDGTFDANPDMIKNGKLDYMCSIYYFVLAPDGKTLKYWCRYTGCWPTTIPYSPLRYAKGQTDLVDIDVPFVYTVKEDMNPKILEEFNLLSMKLVGNENTIPYELLDNAYMNINNSPLLKKESMRTLSAVVDADERDPLIFRIDESQKGVNIDSVPTHYELIFDDFGYTDLLAAEVFDGDTNYYFNDVGTNYGKYEREINWNATEFWREET